MVRGISHGADSDQRTTAPRSSSASAAGVRNGSIMSKVFQRKTSRQGSSQERLMKDDSQCRASGDTENGHRSVHQGRDEEALHEPHSNLPLHHHAHSSTSTAAPTSQRLVPSPREHPVTIDDLSFREKLLLLTGASLWTLHGLPRHHLPSLTVSDGGHGVRKPLVETSLQHAHPATCFPPLCALACSWDQDLLHRVGDAIAAECLYYQVSVLLGPGLNLKRHACGGRNFEYFSEDPLLSGTLAAAFVRGIQRSGRVAACPKHFCVNNQEAHRFVVDAIVDPRTCRELYYRCFEIVVREARPATLMCAYNRVNGTYASEHPFLLKQLLRHEWGFDGVCMTDWGAAHDRAAGIVAGMDLEMPGSHGAHDRGIRIALERGTLSLPDIDVCAHRVLNLIQQYKWAARASQSSVVDWDAHARLAREAASDSIVLLKNDDNILPLARNRSVALIGDFAKDHPRIQGMGSAQVTPNRIEIVYEEIQEYTDKLMFAKGYDGEDDHPTEINAALLHEAVEVAKQCDFTLLFIGLPEIMEAEGMDREHMRLPAQHTALLNEVLAVNSHVVVVLTNGGTVQLPEICCCRAKAILEGYLLGQSGGGAICEILFGRKSPCGKLAETMPLKQEDLSSDKYFPGTRDTVVYFEGLDVGYRYFNTVHKDVQYPFGHGLSYTKFEFSNLRIAVDLDDSQKKRVEVLIDLKNIGSMAGKEVVQLYVHDVNSSVYRPFHELKAYSKVLLEPGENTSVGFSLKEEAFAFWDIGRDEWIVEPGEFEIQIGSSSKSIYLRQVITFESGLYATDIARKSYPPTSESMREGACVETFARRFGQQSDETLNKLTSLGSTSIFNRNSLLKEIAPISLIGRLFLHIVFTEASREIRMGPSAQRQRKMIRANVENLPLRVLVLFSKGGLSFSFLDAIIAIINGYYCLAIALLLYASLLAVTDTILDLVGRRTP